MSNPSSSSFLTLPSPGESGLVAREGWESEISVRHIHLVKRTDAIKASLIHINLEAFLQSHKPAPLVFELCHSVYKRAGVTFEEQGGVSSDFPPLNTKHLHIIILLTMLITLHLLCFMPRAMFLFHVTAHTDETAQIPPHLFVRSGWQRISEDLVW